MTDTMLAAKFDDLAKDILPAARTQRLKDLCWGVETLSDAGQIAVAGAAA